MIVGDGACGKTSLLYVFTLGEFPSEYHPTVFENYNTRCRVDGRSVELALWDTAGQEEYERLRPLSYSNANVILIGFAIDAKDSLDNASTKWIDEVTRYCPGVPVILVGLKKDLRDSESSAHCVQYEKGLLVAKQIGAKTYPECSALSGEGVDDIFEYAARTSLLLSDQEANGCCVIS